MTYEYLCRNCDHRWEQQQRISDEAIKQCPACNEETATRLISADNGFILKGGGWAKDKYSSTND